MRAQPYQISGTPQSIKKKEASPADVSADILGKSWREICYRFLPLLNGPVGLTMNFAILLKCLAPGFELVHRLHFIHWFLAAAHILDGLHGLVVEVLAGLGVVEAALANLFSLLG